MKKLVSLLIMTILACSFILAQETEEETKKQEQYKMNTLFGDQQHSNGGYGAFWRGSSVIDDRNSIQFGVRGSWVIQHSFAIGLGGTGFINEYHHDAILNRDVFLTGGYGGLYLEAIVFPGSPVHLAFPVLLGGGGISFVSYDDINYGSNYVEDYEGFIIIEPGAEVELNLTRFMRLALGVTYRFPSAFEVGHSPANIANADALRGFSYNVTFKFGSF